MAHWSEGLGDLGNLFIRGYDSGRKERLEREQLEAGRAASADMATGLQAMFGGGGGQSLADLGTGSGSGTYTTATAGSQPAHMPVGSGVETRFIDTLKANGLTNPFALAVVGAYGNAESGYSPKNVTGSWSDPSESGKPGTSGGTLSWRAGRFANMRRATAGAADPVAAQAEFFLNEDPALTAKLQNARSLEEANSLMAGAWQFAGWNRPGGENGRRLAMSRNYLGRVSGGGGRTADMPDAGARPIEFAPGDQRSIGFVIPPGPQGPQGADPNRSGMPTLEMLGQITQGGYGASETPPQLPQYSALQNLGDPSSADPSFSTGAGGMGEGPTPSSAAIRFPGAGTSDDRARTMSMDPLGPLAALRPPERPAQSAAPPPLPPRRPAMVEASADGGETLPEVVVPPSSTSGAPQRVVRRNPAAQVARPVQAPGIPADERGRVQHGAGYGNNQEDGGARAFLSDPSTAPAGYGPAQLPGPPLMVSNPMGGVSAQAPMRSPVPAIRQDGAPVTRQAAVETPLPPARTSDLGVPATTPGTSPVAAQGAPGGDPAVQVRGYDGTWTRSTAPGDGRTGPSAAEVAAAQRGGAPASAPPASSEPAAAVPARAPNGMPNWQTTDQVPQPVQGAIGRANISKLIAWTANPNLPAGAREVAKMFLTRALDESKMPDGVKEYVWARSQGMTTATSPNAYAREKRDSDEGDKIRETTAARKQIAAELGYKPGTPDYNHVVLEGKAPAAAASGSAAEKALPAELGARIALGQSFLDQAPEIRRQVQAGGITGLWDAAKARSGRGEQGELMRRLKTGSEAIIRNLTGAGMNQAEAEDRVRQYEPVWTDDAATVVKKLDMMTDILHRTEAEAYRGRGIPEGRRGKNPYFPQEGGQAGAPQAQAGASAREAAPAARAPSAVPGAAVQALRSDPRLASQFEAKYGAGSAAQYLGGQ